MRNLQQFFVVDLVSDNELPRMERAKFFTSLFVCLKRSKGSEKAQ
jgi:hypothetical protein